MGLDISSKSSKEYHFGYGGIHYVRYYAYKVCGGEKDFIGYSNMARDDSYDWEGVLAHALFPNLMIHSDCEGSYTLKGKVNPFVSRDLYTGNSTELLKELQFIIKKYKQDGVRDDSLKALYALVKDVVKNHNGKLTFN